MTTQPVTGAVPSADSVESQLLAHLEERTRTVVAPEQDLFATGVVSSLFAMELVVHLESTYDVSIVGSDLKQDNFRSVRRMTELVLRLRAGDA
ncbi:acyl carrier protein [Actinoplanes sp. DH11]|uniref:acyl carrier protein n=1 Tax=Actinoplanes sp. DH11 TaxID=2857011 RepID=UPI001E5E4625|nr:acyl carrier protein [Actinoplanes sp. DH11]